MTTALIPFGTVDNASLVESWISYADVRKSTQKTYFKGAKFFLSYLMQNSIVVPERENIIAYREFLKSELSPSSARLYFSIARIFVGWLATKKICSRDIFDNVKQIKFCDDEKHLRDAVSVDECRAAIGCCDDSSEKGLREKICLALMGVCGLRTCEVVRLTVKDVQRKNGHYLLQVLGKGRDKKTEVPLPASIAAMIQTYLNIRITRGSVVEKDSPLFVSISNRNFDERLDTQTISRLAKRVLRQIGVDETKKSAHSFRACTATTAILAGVPIREISKLLRHKSLLTTERYCKDLEHNDTADIVAAKIFERGR